MSARASGRLRHLGRASVAASVLVSAAAIAEPLPAPLDCVIEPSMLVNIGSEADGVIASVDVERGDLVEKGQLLATLDDNLERASSKLYRARANNDVTVRFSDVKRRFGRRSAERIRRLQRASVASEQEVDQAVTDENLTTLKLEEAKINRRLAQLEFERAEAALAQRRLLSPVRALVVERLMHPGERVTDQPILSLAAIDVLHVEVIAPMALHGRVKVGQRARVVPEEPVGGEYQATVSVVDRVMDARSGTFGVRLSLPNPDHALPAGLRCTVSFLLEPVMAGGDEPPEQPSAVQPPQPSRPANIDTKTATPDPNGDQGGDERIAEHPLQNLPPLVAPTPPPAEPATGTSIAAALLDSALPTARAAAPESAPGAGASPAPGPETASCLTVGKFETRSQASAILKFVADDGIHGSTREVISGSPKGYLLLVSTHGDPERAISQLRAKGLDDIQLLRSGPHGGHLSVGYFRQRKAAQTHRAELVKQGIDAVLAPRGEASRQFWVDLRVADEGARERIAHRLRATDARLITEPLPCPGTLNASL